MKTTRPTHWFSSSAARAATLLLSLASGACAQTFEPSSTVSDVRILAVQGSPPFAAPGESVALHALAVDPHGRKLSVAWTTCVNPSSSKAVACFAKMASDATAGHMPEITMGDVLTDYTLIVPSDALSALPPEAAASAEMGVVTVVCPGTISFNPAEWRPGAPPVACLDGSGVPLPPEGFVVSVKRIAIRAHDRNANPGIAAITWNGAPWPETETREVTPCRNDPTLFADCDGGEEATVGIVAAPGAVEVGIDEQGAPFTEQLIADYYVPQGAFEFDVRSIESPETRWAARRSASGTDQTMWLVVRDDRGGVSWTSRRVHVR